MTVEQLHELYSLNERIIDAKRDNERLIEFISMAEKSIENSWIRNQVGWIWNALLKLIYPKHVGYFSYEVLDKKTLLKILQIAYEYNNSRLKQLEHEFELIKVDK